MLMEQIGTSKEGNLDILEMVSRKKTYYQILKEQMVHQKTGVLMFLNG